MKQRLTERQNQAYEYIRDYIRTHGLPPTLKEIGSALGISSTNGVSKLISILERKGYLEKKQHVARGLRLKEDTGPEAENDRPARLMMISKTSSERPEELRSRPSGFLTVDPYFLRSVVEPEACLIARVADEGMLRDGIRKGDFVIVEEIAWTQLSGGEIAAFLVGAEVKVRRFHHREGRLHLVPSDRTHTEETYLPEDPKCYAIGRVVATLRRL